jgi:uncharacterized protein YoxC
MNDFLKQDIFFFVTTIAVIILTVLLSILAVYFIRISRKINNIVGRAEEQTNLLSEDLNALRSNVREGGMKIKHFLEFFKSINKRKR